MPDLKKEGQETSGSPADKDATEVSSTPADGNEDSSTSKTEPETLEDAVSSALAGASDDEEGAAPKVEPEGDAEGDDKSGEGEQAKSATDDGASDGDGDDAGKSDDDKDLHKAPEGLSEKGKVRVEKLVAANKESVAANDELNQKVDSFYQVLERSGANPQEFKDLIEFSHNVKSGNTEKAMQFLETQRTALALNAGLDVPGVDPLEGFDDLKEKVSSMALPKEDAIEIAKGRRDDQRRVDEAAEAEAAQNQSTTSVAAIEQGKKDVSTLIASLKSSDIDFPAKFDLLMAKAETLGTLSPERWGPSLQLYYDGLSHVQATKDLKPKPQPLTNNGGGGGTREASSLAEAVSMSLEKSASK